MRDSRVRYVPVVDDGYRVVGVLTSGDLPAATALPPAATDDEPIRVVESALAAAEAAARTARTVLAFAAPHETAVEAGRRMIENEIDFLPVVDDGGKLLGLVTQEHFLRWSTSRMADERRTGSGRG